MTRLYTRIAKKFNFRNLNTLPGWNPGIDLWVVFLIQEMVRFEVTQEAKRVENG